MNVFKSLVKSFGLLVMKNPATWLYICAFLGMLVGFCGNTLCAYLLGLVFGQAQAFAFVSLVATSLWYVFNINKLFDQLETQILKLQTLKAILN